MKCSVVIPAAGSGSRFGSEVPKQFLELRGRTIIEHTIERFLAFDEVTRIAIAVAGEHEPYLRKLAAKNAWDRVITVVGGSTRQSSVLNGVISIREGSQIVAVHDAVRPMFRRETFAKLLDTTRNAAGAVPVVKPRDTIHRIQGERIVATMNRNELAAAQTPQVFRIDVLLPALERAAREGRIHTDEAGLVAGYGHEVRVVEGDACNVKITTPDDLTVVDAHFESWSDS